MNSQIYREAVYIFYGKMSDAGDQRAAWVG